MHWANILCSALVFITPAEMSSPNPSTLTTLPLELRDKLYQDLLKDTNPALSIDQHTDTTDPQFLANRLPDCLRINSQIIQEASLVYLEHAHIFNGVPDLSGLTKLLSQFPDESAFRRVRSLEFTHPYDRYARSRDEDGNGKEEDVEPESYAPHDIVSRCTGIRELTLMVPGSMFVKRGATQNASMSMYNTDGPKGRPGDLDLRFFSKL